jgi:hypothetical protein
MTGTSGRGAAEVVGYSLGRRVGAGVLARPREALALLRLATGAAALLGVVLFVFGTSWDIQWHSFIGRDRVLIPPHVLMLGGIALCGVAALSEVGVESFWARAYQGFAALGTPFAGAFSASLGAYVAGFAALAAAVGFPLDVYWHALYGIDASVWAPFHVMIISGMSIAALGVSHILLSGANLADGTTLARIVRPARIGALVAIGAMLWALLFFLDASFDDAAIHLGPIVIDTYSLMIGGFGGFALALAVAAWPTRFTAVGVAAVYYAIDLAAFLLIPPLTEALRVAEHQAYRRGGLPPYVVVSYITPILLIVAAVAIDWAASRARRAQLPAAALRARVGRAAVVGLLVAAVLNLVYLPVMFSVVFSQPRALYALVALLAFAAALGLGAAGAWLGSGLGLDVGKSLQGVER